MPLVLAVPFYQDIQFNDSALMPNFQVPFSWQDSSGAKSFVHLKTYAFSLPLPYASTDGASGISTPSIPHLIPG
ncbi:hypothetical protein GGP41_009686 [Bipolaris sorokiniana]|uniref:Uncharacterized protein n=1 Tax=Cochliobolus sativus TaxID=45130 RepID=A0A8H5ZDX1_COCSA|nr:hypothetical protein GGP41_009686 [Bipolaris sorokiniana]